MSKLIQDFDIIIEDLEELLSFKDIFMAGTIFGKTHGLISIQKIFKSFILINQIQDNGIKNKYLEKLNQINKEENLDELMNKSSQYVSDQENKQVKIVQKELDQLNNEINIQLCQPDECCFYQELLTKKQEYDKSYEELYEKYIEEHQKLQEYHYKEEIKQIVQLQKQSQEKKQIEESLCQICNQNLFNEVDQEQDLTTFQNCSHVFHKNCIIEYLSKQNNQLIVLCPYNSCQKMIHKDDIQEHIKLSKIMQCCFSQDCTFIFAKDSNVIHNDVLDCPLCNNMYCMICELNINNQVDHNCRKEFQKQCPKCSYLLKKQNPQYEKRWMFCRCSYKFCFYCLQNEHTCKCHQFIDNNQKDEKDEGFGQLGKK